MPDDRYPAPIAEAEQQAAKLAALIDEAGDDLERNGPVSPSELRRRLVALEAEWSDPEATRASGGNSQRSPG